MTEFFERFTYYGMRALLVLFLVAATDWRATPASASTARPRPIYGLYTGAVSSRPCPAAGSPTG